MMVLNSIFIVSFKCPKMTKACAYSFTGKSTEDSIDGYLRVELAKENHHKTTFATEWGL